MAMDFAFKRLDCFKLIKENPKPSSTRTIELFHIEALIVFFSIQKSSNIEKLKPSDTRRKPLPMVSDFSFQEGPHR